MIYEIQIKGRRIEIWFSLWNGKERVSYDGKVVSEKRSFMFETIHSFEVDEDSEQVVYEVIIKTGFLGYGYIIRRNGIIQAHKP